MKSFLASKLNLLSQRQFQQENDHIQKGVGDDLQAHPGVSHWNTDVILVIL